ncbi:Hypothetical protein LBF_2731 [Leptospira biflexa serovar Patoc strain 'Patoc 1 (Ames)']|uniref:Uncharacterized protein n=1 Tax=Leptospira biflexa serovar Patoc (strain Patoc 1 / ATCC 23582 / Paris) TaxID=456481 RepID=B0SND1_LEPBP|nr:hypothetical protein [Leptospira biflexa]ABZ95212.1 Hypothetical protein LBF_2731 [Leptospira biflexa serovar Patoc strain 'Patoc 1 (Ames)']ABZ98898.1 Hypothetical protein LEPBI_I2823 [Leptospira biflexa serovar Patoc strain 'Patoc 1 (Paris)']
MKQQYWIFVPLILTSFLFANPKKKVELKSLGLSIEKPDTWEDVTDEEFRDSKNQLHLESKTFTKLLHENNELPLFSIRKGDPEIDQYLTIINIKALKSELEFHNIPVDLRTYLFRVSMALKKFEYLIEPKAVRINGNLAGFALFSHIIMDEDQNETQVVSAIWIFPRKGYFYMIGSGMVQNDFEPILEEVKQIVSSFKISK